MAGAVQLFRDRCYKDVGAIIPFSMGGEDAYAEVMARMRGWEVEAFPDIRILHHRKSTSARGVVKEFFTNGVMDYALGYHPFFELLKGINRIKENPPVAAAMLRMSGFAWSYALRRKRPVPAEFIHHLRHEQLDLVRAALRAVLGSPRGNRKQPDRP